eukprot:Pgem_evm1s13407
MSGKCNITALSFDGHPIGTVIDIYVYSLLQGCILTMIVVSLFYYRHTYTSACRKVIRKDENIFLKIKSILILFTIPAFIGYCSIALGDVLNATCVISNTAYTSWISV